MTTKTVNLNTSTTMEVVSALTSGLDQISVSFPMLVDLNDLSINGIALTEQTMIRLIENLRDLVSFSVIRGSISSNEFGSVTYSDQRYFTYERIDKTVSANDFNIRINKFNHFKLYVSENNWIDLHFVKADGTIFTMVIVP